VGGDDRAGGNGFGSGLISLGGGAPAQRLVRPDGVVEGLEPVQRCCSPDQSAGLRLSPQPFLLGLVEPFDATASTPKSSTGTSKATLLTTPACSPTSCKSARTTTTTTALTALLPAKHPTNDYDRKPKTHCHRPSSVTHPWLHQ
jgi:hypothetical protein